MTRREMLVAMLQALLLALFPWMRTERGFEIAGRAADSIVPVMREYGMWAQQAMYFLARSYNLAWSQRA